MDWAIIVREFRKIVGISVGAGFHRSKGTDGGQWPKHPRLADGQAEP